MNKLRKQPFTQRMIAEKVGVGRATASCVLSGKRDALRPELVERVRKAAAEPEYVLNRRIEITPERKRIMTKWLNRAFLHFLPIPCIANVAVAQETKSANPNIILIMTDDMGYSDIGCFGSEIRTPNIDWLAAHGTRFTQFYTNPVCTPARASLLTGRYAHQAGLATNNTWPSFNPALSEKEQSEAAAKRGNSFWQEQSYPGYNVLRTDTCITLGQAMRQAGYQTLMSGKWHVGDEKRFWPVNLGFDRSFVMIWGGGSHFNPPWCPYALDDKVFTDFPKDFYTTDFFFKYAIDFIEKTDRKKPFFLYLTPSAPHSPFQAPEEEIKKYDGVYDVGWDVIREQRLARQKAMGLFPAGTKLPPRFAEHHTWAEEKNKEAAANSMEVMAGMMDRVDQRVGDLIATLRRIGELDNTLIVFFSDNGGDPTIFGSPASAFHEWGETRNTPLSKQKGLVHEGGIRTPFIAFWPGHIPENAINHEQVGHVMDLMQTFLSAAQSTYPTTYEGRKISPSEGIDLLPSMINPSLHSPRSLCWEFAGGEAIREGDWKLVREFTPIYFGKGDVTERGDIWALYNVSEDPGEMHNRINEFPEKAAAMQAEFSKWGNRVGVVPYEDICKAQAEFNEQKKTK